MQVLAKDAGHHGHKSKHDSDDHHDLQCRIYFMSVMDKMHEFGIPTARQG